MEALAARIVASPTSTVPGAATDWMRAAVLTRSPATIPSLVAPMVTAASPLMTPARAWIPGPMALHGVDQLQAGANGPFRVVLACRRGAPDGHHRVADELLDDPAVQLHDLGRDAEVPGQGLAHLLRVAFLGERREADQVREQDTHEPAFRDESCSSPLTAGRPSDSRAPARTPAVERRPAIATEPLAGRIDRTACWTPRRERCTTVATEPLAGRIVGPAARADHRVVPGRVIAVTGYRQGHRPWGLPYPAARPDSATTRNDRAAIVRAGFIAAVRQPGWGRRGWRRRRGSHR